MKNFFFILSKHKKISIVISVIFLSSILFFLFQLFPNNKTAYDPNYLSNLLHINKNLPVGKIKEYKYNVPYNIDLDGDGVDETVKSVITSETAPPTYIPTPGKPFPEYDPNFTSITIYINNDILFSKSGYRSDTRDFYITDLDPLDKKKEITIPALSPDKEYPLHNEFYFYQFKDKKLTRISGLFFDLTTAKFMNDGKFAIQIPLGLLQDTWYGYQVFQLTKQNRIQKIDHDIFISDPEYSSVTLIKNCYFYSNKSKKSMITYIRSPQKGYVDQTDDKQWCHFIFEDGKEGWLYFSDLYYIKTPFSKERYCFDYFNGLRIGD